MALNIKDPETDRLARELATLTGESITDATRRAIEERLRLVRRSHRAERDLSGIIRRGRARSVLDARPSDEILGYGTDGLPT
jgi:antitoxin VapB